ncbi:unnamed protein product [Anisakis simplex]|uniref:G-protein coupled receptors family 1 profile domain-containing protein n=1 Tax=Anisakis simplex TaxID=6269 RepID=A0A3P6PEH8_ANISI|nr:unnamed protein product [Anisakis simplex]
MIRDVPNFRVQLVILCIFLIIVIPCILLFTFTVALLKKLDESRSNRQLLKFINEDYNSNTNANNSTKSTIHLSDRTTKVLVTTLMIFLISELPQG